MVTAFEAEKNRKAFIYTLMICSGLLLLFILCDFESPMLRLFIRSELEKTSFLVLICCSRFLRIVLTIEKRSDLV